VARKAIIRRTGSDQRAANDYHEKSEQLLVGRNYFVPVTPSP